MYNHIFCQYHCEVCEVSIHYLSLISILIYYRIILLQILRRFDWALLPPCQITLPQKVARAHYLTMIWCNADSPHLARGLKPEEYGWKLENEIFVPMWYDGPSTPTENLFDQGDTTEEIDTVEFDNEEDDEQWSNDFDDVS